MWRRAGLGGAGGAVKNEATKASQKRRGESGGAERREYKEAPARAKTRATDSGGMIGSTAKRDKHGKSRAGRARRAAEEHAKKTAAPSKSNHFKKAGCQTQASHAV